MAELENPRSDEHDEFYTGYLPRSPPGIASWVKRSVVLLFLLTGAIAALLVNAQKPFSKAFYEFGVVREFEGVVRGAPYPNLEVRRPGAAGEAASVSRYYLVHPFKFGAEVAEYEDRLVRLKGSLLYRDDQTMLEILPGEIEAIGTAGAPSAERSRGRQILAGMIVDSKCYLGIMKPGETKVHRACATRCISGGIPPLFVVRDPAGPARHLLLVGADGRAVNREVLDMIAEPLRIEGEVVELDDLWILKADPSTYERLVPAAAPEGE